MLLSIRQASRALGVPRQYLRQLIESGQLIYYKYDKRTLVDLISARAVLDRIRLR